MVSEVSGPMVNEVNVVADKPVGRSFPNKRNHGKIPKKIHKAEREKMKRDHMNELFLELGNALEPTRQNSGKASILDDATRIVRDLLIQVKSLKRENVALLSESHYVTVEKNELKDENAILESQIEKLQTQLRERTLARPGWDAAPAQLQINNSPAQFSEDHITLPVAEPTLQTPPVMGTVLVIPLHHDVQTCPELEAAQTGYKPPSNVSRPHARYPTPSDSWPSQLLGKNPKTAAEATHLKNNSSSSSRDEQGSGNE
ncbi:Myc-type [Macleaya cordata]|uniref:Myc-type n=1 Tax=Macleaya cordata TaxID=56857 RepID=A0A200QSC8_MACCD|nr:Myc-type [Macleaya cordata]